ncbi:MAG: TonB-dependent receptor [Hyphomonas sp.]|nr:TonB-dependent receptor [Hyphomonas sp.]
MSIKFKSIATNSAAMLALAAAAWPALAQETPDPDPGVDREVRLGNVTVTAQRREESLQDVPVSVGVVDGGEMAEQNISSLQELSTRQASMVVRETPGGDQIAIRGTASGFNAGFEQSVATFVDGVYRPRARSSRVAMFDVERVEVLRGPQTTFFGANAIAGALNITTRKPGEEFGINGSAFYSPDDDEYNLELGLDAPLGDKAGLRIAGRVAAVDSPTILTRTNQRGED